MVVCLCLLGVAMALPSATYTQDSSLRSLLQKQNPKDVTEAFYITESLSRVGGAVQDKENFCRMARDVLKEAENIKLVYCAVFVSEDLNCGESASQKVQSLIFNAVESSSPSVEDLFFATSAAYKLQENNHISFDQKRFFSVIDTLSELSTMDGSVKNNKRSSRGSMYFSGLAFQTAALIAKNANLDEDHEFSVGIFKENMEGLLELATETDDGTMFIDRGDSRTAFRATNNFLQGVFALADDVDPITVELLDDIIGHVLANVPYASLSNVYHFTALMELLTSDKVPRSAVLSVPQTTFSMTNKADGTVTAHVTDILGNAIPDVKVFLLKATSFADDAVLYSHQPLVKRTDTDFEFNLFAAKPQQGFYALEFGVQVGNKATRSTVRTIKVVTSVSVGTVKVNVVDSSDKEVVQRVTATPGKEFETFKTSYFFALDVSFTIKNDATNKPTKIQQVYLRFEGEESEHSFPVEAAGDSYRLLLDMKHAGPFLLFRSGDYRVSLIIGDTFIDNSFIRDLGTVQLFFPPHLEKPQPESVYNEKPEIHHVFRVPDRRPHSTLSLTFAGGVLAPAALLVLSILIVGFPIRVPGGLSFIFTLVFLGVIVSIFTAYAGFWFGYYNMFDTLYMVLALGVLGVVSGYQSLRSRRAARVAREEQVVTKKKSE